jgi:GTPase
MKQIAILAGANLNNQEGFSYSMEELGNLTLGCDMEVYGKVTQNLNRVNPSHYLGSGKLQEIKDLIEQGKAQVVIFNDELSSSQIRNLEELLECKVIDRTTLILDIFGQRAKTREAKLQVEVARLQYMLPRLVGQGENMGRQRSGVGVRNRGAGETKLELDRRRIEEKISDLNDELDSLVSQRKIQRNQRKKSELPIVSLVGYTNAGKSTIMNAMVELFSQSPSKQVFEKDMLFATLETSVRSIKLPDNRSFLLTDTVGFVSKLPHNLVKAFRSTLEEAAQSDLLIHVVDCSSENFKQLMEVTNNTLKEIGIENIPIIYAYNKADLIDFKVAAQPEDGLYLAAKHRIGVAELAALISKNIFKDYVQCELLIPYDQGTVISYLTQNAHVLSTSYENEGTKMMVQCKALDYKRYKTYAIG